MTVGHVIRTTAEWLIVALVVFALLFEFILHRVERWVFKRHPHVQTILRNLYRELMILGVVSFGFIIYQFAGDPSNDALLTFEVAHIFIFLFALFHSVTVSVTIFISLSLSHHWKKLEKMELVNYLEVKEKYKKLNEQRSTRSSFVWKNFIWFLPKISKFFKWRNLHEIIIFHDVRWQFIYYRNLPPDFRFSKFLRKIKFATFIELVEINPVNWIMLLVLVILDIIRGHAFKITKTNFEPIFLICQSAFNMLVVTLLASKIRRIYWKMTKNPATYYDAVDPVAFREELAIAEEEARIRRGVSIETGSKDTADDPDTPFHHPGKERISVSSGEGHGNGNGNGNELMAKIKRRRSQDGAHEAPLYTTMAYKPGASETNRSSLEVRGHRTDRFGPELGDRHSLDMNKIRERASNASTEMKPKKYTPGLEDEAAAARVGRVAGNLLERARLEHEKTPGNTRMSLDMVAAIPRNELDLRAQPPLSNGVGIVDEDDIQRMIHISQSRRDLRMEALRRVRERKSRNAAIVETAQDLQAAQASTPTKTYPDWVIFLFPRLGRVASTTERLFWFGSHRFYLFCVETALFFTNVTLSASLAKVAFFFKDTKPTGESIVFLSISTAVAAAALVYGLFRIAGIMKKYVFVLNNANLLPENITLETIRRVNLKDVMEAETMRDDVGERLIPYESETDDEKHDDQSNSRAVRGNLSKFIGNQKEEEEKARSGDNLEPLGSSSNEITNGIDR